VKNLNFLFAGYAAFWAILFGYLGVMFSRQRRLMREVEELRRDLPELPDTRKARFISDYGLSAYDAGLLVAERETAEFFEAVVGAKGAVRDPKTAANWLTGEFFAALNRSGLDIAAAPVDAAGLGGLLDLIADGTVSGRLAKDVFEAMWQSGKDAAAIVEEKGLKQISDTGEIEAIVERIVADNAKQVEQFKSGNEKILGWFVGQVMKQTQGKANPGVVNQILRQKLS